MNIDWGVTYADEEGWCGVIDQFPTEEAAVKFADTLVSEGVYPVIRLYKDDVMVKEFDYYYKGTSNFPPPQHKE